MVIERAASRQNYMSTGENVLEGQMRISYLLLQNIIARPQTDPRNESQRTHDSVQSTFHEQYAVDFDIIFNGSNSKFIVFR